MNWRVKIFDGYSNNERFYNNISYDELSYRLASLPPGYIWHIEPI